MSDAPSIPGMFLGAKAKRQHCSTRTWGIEAALRVTIRLSPYPAGLTAAPQGYVRRYQVTSQVCMRQTYVTCNSAQALFILNVRVSFAFI